MVQALTNFSVAIVLELSSARKTWQSENQNLFFAMRPEFVSENLIPYSIE